MVDGLLFKTTKLAKLNQVAKFNNNSLHVLFATKIIFQNNIPPTVHFYGALETEGLFSLDKNYLSFLGEEFVKGPHVVKVIINKSWG